MKNRFNVMVGLLILFLFRTVQCQDLTKIKGSFEQLIDKELNSLKEWGEEEKANPEKTISYWDFSHNWHAFYEEYFTYNYDIQKTNSIMSPYIGIVTFDGRRYEKVGDTKKECLNAQWKDVGQTIPTLKYAYQDTSWILKEVPRAYKKH